MPYEPYVSKVVPSIGEFKVIVDKVIDARDTSKVLYYTVKDLTQDHSLELNLTQRSKLPQELKSRPLFAQLLTLIPCGTLSVGGNKDKCVNITVPTDINDKVCKLSWAETTKECSLDTMKIKGNSTQIMLQLAITLAREIAPHITQILLNDMSHFQCNTPEGDIKTHLPSYYIALYGKTWYEEKFGAVINNPETHQRYRSHIPNLLNPKYKPAYFDFVNKDLIHILTPIYNESTCWQDFFNRLSEKYGDTKCGIMYPWVMNALLICFEGSLLYIGTEWRIDINSKNTPKIKYHEYTLGNTIGGSMKHILPTINPYIETDVNYNQVVGWKYKKNASSRRKQRNYTKRKNIQ